MYWVDAALGTLNWALLPEGAYTGSRLAAWISSNFATATYSETTNSLSVAYDGNRLILNDLELQQQFPNVVDYPTSPAASPSKPFSIDHMLGPSFVSSGQQVFEFVRMMAYNEVYLRCPQLANASRVLGNLGDDILSKITLKRPAPMTGTSWRVLQRLRVGVLAGLHEIAQVEVARDVVALRSGWSRGQRLIPLQVAHHLLEARALAEAVGPKRLHFYCCATSPAARSTPLRSARA